MDEQRLAVSENVWVRLAPLLPGKKGDSGATGKVPAIRRGGDRPLDSLAVFSALYQRDLLPAPPPINPSFLAQWRQRIGEDGLEWLLTKTIEAERKSGTVDEDSLSRVALDTTVIEKNIAHATDGRLYEKARGQLVAIAVEGGMELRQNYNRLASPLTMQVASYAHARQFKRMRKALKKLKGYTGRVLRDLRRLLDDIPEGSLRNRILAKLALISQLLHQQPKGADKIYALHEPELDCISKGKARVRYEFGTKVSIATTIDECFVVGMRALPDNPYDGHTLALEQVEVMTDRRPSLAVVDRGHGVARTKVLISGTRKGVTPMLAKLLRRRNTIEPEIGHMKSDGRLARCPLKGTIGDAIFAVLCGCGHNIRKILARIRAILTVILAYWLATRCAKFHNTNVQITA